MHLLRELRLVLSQSVQPIPRPEVRNDASCLHRRATHFNPNSMRVSFRYCPLSSRLRSPRVMFTAPVPEGGYTKTLGTRPIST